MRILIIEDNRNLVHGLRHHSSWEGAIWCSAAFHRAQGWSAPARRDCKLILLDLTIPRPDGFQVLRTLREESIETPVIVLTARGEEADKVRGLRASARTTVTDDSVCCSSRLARVDAVRRRLRLAARPGRGRPESCFGDVVVGPVRRGRSTGPARRSRFGQGVRSPARAGEGPGHVVSRDDLLEEVWRYDPDVVSRTLDTHVGQLRQKLEPRPGYTLYILTVRKNGYRLWLDAGGAREEDRQAADRRAISVLGCAHDCRMHLKGAPSCCRARGGEPWRRVRWPDGRSGTTVRTT